MCLVLCLGISASFADDKIINLTVDDRYWYPFTYQEESEIKGMQVDIIRDALNNLGYQINIKTFPYKRCLKTTDAGEADGIISIAYTPDIKDILIFPEDAGKVDESNWRIMQVDHMVLTVVSNSYEFEGDIKTLPIPVRIPTGDAIASDLEKAGVVIEDAKTDKQNIAKLIRDQKGSVITTSVIAEIMNQATEFKGAFNISPTPVNSQSYFLAFAKKTKIPQDEMLKIWNEIKRLRDDYVYMLKLYAQY
jgi:hypothetical protein